MNLPSIRSLPTGRDRSMPCIFWTNVCDDRIETGADYCTQGCLIMSSCQYIIEGDTTIRTMESVRHEKNRWRPGWPRAHCRCTDYGILLLELWRLVLSLLYTCCPGRVLRCAFFKRLFLLWLWCPAA
jgi:hypothetical protein